MSPEASPFVFIGNHRALDFVNTEVAIDGAPPRPARRAFRSWWSGSRGPARSTPPRHAPHWRGGGASGRARRCWPRRGSCVRRLRRLADAAAEGRAPPRTTVERVNALLGRGASVTRVAAVESGGFVARRGLRLRAAGRSPGADRGGRRRPPLRGRPRPRPPLRPSRVRALLPRRHQERHPALVRHADLRQPRQCRRLLPPPPRRAGGALTRPLPAAEWALTYCDVAPGHEWHGPYHDDEYGFPLTGDAELFERLVLEINQAGLSWLTILKKRDAFRRAYGGFDPEIVAAYRARDRRRLLADAGIIRNRLKVDAAIANAADDPGAEGVARLVRRLARRTPSPLESRVGQAVQADVPVHGRGDRRGVPDEHRVPAGGARGELSGLPARCGAPAGVDADGGRRSAARLSSAPSQSHATRPS